MPSWGSTPATKEKASASGIWARETVIPERISCLLATSQMNGFVGVKLLLTLDEDSEGFFELTSLDLAVAGTSVPRETATISVVAARAVSSLGGIFIIFIKKRKIE